MTYEHQPHIRLCCATLGCFLLCCLFGILSVFILGGMSSDITSFYFDMRKHFMEHEIDVNVKEAPSVKEASRRVKEASRSVKRQGSVKERQRSVKEASSVMEASRSIKEASRSVKEGANNESLSEEDLRVIQIIRDDFLEAPSNQSYNLEDVMEFDPSQWQTKEIRKILGNKRNGFFVESGAFDGEKASNTLMLEKDLGWKGVLIEPEPSHYQSLLSKHRKAWTIQCCLSPNSNPGKVLFQRDGWGSAIAQLSHQKRHADTVQVECFPLASILAALNVTKIDYWSLDVEGIEFEVLQTVPWHKVNITTISVEHQFLGSKKRKLISYLTGLGYKLYTDYPAQKMQIIVDYIFYHPKLLP